MSLSTVIVAINARLLGSVHGAQAARDHAMASRHLKRSLESCGCGLSPLYGQNGAHGIRR